MTLKTFIWNHILAVLAGSFLVVLSIVAYQIIKEGETRFEGVFYMFLLFTAISFVLSLPYAVIMSFFTRRSFELKSWTSQKYTQIGLSFLAVLIGFTISYFNDSLEVSMILATIITVYGVVGTAFIFYPRESFRYTKLQIK